MNPETMRRIDAMIEGTISRPDFEVLQQTLRDDPVALRHYIQQAEIDGRLTWELAQAGGGETMSGPVPAPRPVARRTYIAAWAAAAALIVGGLFVYSFNRPATA
ncbi:hypothetical protein, partial [Luteolibacter marinus]|uniref:hypothetical protein n=1 Tax=Luteolibacter marinus TaxID=2776705 RepID=UPI001868D72C